VLPDEKTPVEVEPEEELSVSDFEMESDLTPAPVDAAHRKFGRYRLKYQIASGGMASVFLAGAAGAAGFEKPVAIKRMHPHLARRKAYVDMFLDEAKITSRINHPNVCQVFDFGETDGAYYMALEYLLGAPLSGILAQVKRRGAERSTGWHAIAASICASVSEGLHAAHELRDETGQSLEVVHRDVSPSNVIVTFDGGVKVVDFGVAKARGRIHQTTTGTLKGKFSYMAPEQVSGQSIDRRADVWSVGVCLWEMLTVKRLFRRDSEMETLMAVGQGPIASPAEENDTVPEALGRIALRALERDPNTRYQTSREMSRELEAWIRSQGQPAGMADIADFLAATLSNEHSSKVLFVQTAMRERSAEDVSAAETRVLEGTPSAAGPLTPFSDSKSHTRPRIVAEEITSSATLKTRAASASPALLIAMAAVLFAALVVAIVAVVLAFRPDADPIVATPLTPSGAHAPVTAPESPVAMPEVATGDGADESPEAQNESLAEAQLERLRELEAREAERLRREEERRTEDAQRMTRPAMTTQPRGTLFLTGGGAEVSIDGAARGRTPWRGELSAGRHSVVLEKNGQTRRLTVTIESGQTLVRPIGL
jgi:serine/threonine-protein kinase